jgi:hypothetical protein
LVLVAMARKKIGPEVKGATSGRQSFMKTTREETGRHNIVPQVPGVVKKKNGPEVG